MGFEKGNKIKGLYTICVPTCAKEKAYVPGKGYSELCTAASRAELLKARKKFHTLKFL